MNNNNTNILCGDKKLKMNSKKQQSASSSESSSSSSSNSSSSSSSSSGSDSSSSDSEGTSSSQNSNKSAPDSDKTQQKRAKPIASNIKPKKPEEKKIIPVKQPPPKKGAAIYSSESDESLTKTTTGKRRLSTTKPKVTATVNVAQKTAKASTRPVRNSRSENSHKNVTDKTVKNAKARSIFSPDNSSESDIERNNKSTGVSCNTRSLTKTALNNKLKENDVKKNRKRSRSSASASTSESTESSSDSDSSDNSSLSNSKIKPKTMSDKQDSEKTESENSRNQTIKSKTSESSEVESNKRGIITRKLTRSSSARRSKHLIGKLGTDTESETDSKTSKTGKKIGPKGPIVRNKNSKGLPSKQTSILHCEIQTERKCPVEGCNSLGHLGGNYEKHFTVEACPLYHNNTPEECKQMAEERKKKEEERKRTIMSMSRKSPKSHTHHLNSEQRSYQLMVKEIREKFQEKLETNDVKLEEKEKEPRLEGIASEHDLKLFREAQAAASEKIEDDLKSLPNIKHTKYVEMGRFEMEVWYQSPYPEDYARLPKLYLCEYCLKYMKTRTILKRHIVKCVWRHPPGEEVYRKDRLSVWEVDGKRYKQYCQNLCLLAKFFLDHKTLYYDVEPFLFYVMTIGDAEGCHTVGYFSKEKNSFLNYNVSCILTLPPYQRQGYGRLLIDFSYLLTREEGKIGSPEKPLSDLGLISYRSYWKDVLLEYLCNFGGKEISIKDISQEMAINSYDIVSTLQALGMMKYWKGKHIILKKQDEIEEYIERAKRRDLAHKEIDKKCLKWAPFTPSQPQNSS